MVGGWRGGNPDPGARRSFAGGAFVTGDKSAHTRSDVCTQLSILDVEPGRVRLVGEADLSTSGPLATALQRLAQGPGDVIVDVRGLRFVDARSVGLFVQTAELLGPSRRLVLYGATGLVARVLSLLRIDQHARITVVSLGRTDG